MNKEKLEVIQNFIKSDKNVWKFNRKTGRKGQHRKTIIYMAYSDRNVLDAIYNLIQTLYE